jgi:hypothetical protein
MDQDFRRYCDFQLTSILLLEFIISAAFLWPLAFLEALDEADGLEQVNTPSENRSRQFTVRPVPTKFVSVPHWRSRITVRSYVLARTSGVFAFHPSLNSVIISNFASVPRQRASRLAS